MMMANEAKTAKCNNQAVIATQHIFDFFVHTNTVQSQCTNHVQSSLLSNNDGLL